MININKRILIVCEDGKSSKLYFEAFKKDKKLKRDLASVMIKVVHPRDHSPLGLVKAAKKKKLKARRERNPYDEIWIVLDKDYHANIDKAFNMARDNKIHIALSSICFEYWVLLHFEKTMKAFRKCDKIISYIRRKHYSNYLKKSNAYPVLIEKTKLAISNGKWVVKQNMNDIERGVKLYELAAYTDVHLLVEKLINPKKYLLF